MSVYSDVLSLLESKGIDFKVRHHPPVKTIKDAEEKAAELVEDLLKTIAFRIKDSVWVLAAVRCRDRIDYRKLAASLGVNRRQLFSLSPEEVQAELGYEIGGVGPIPLRNDVIAIFDNHLADAGTVRCGSGSNTRTLELQFADLLRATGGRTCDIVRNSAPTEEPP